MMCVFDVRDTCDVCFVYVLCLYYLNAYVCVCRKACECVSV